MPPPHQPDRPSLKPSLRILCLVHEAHGVLQGLVLPEVSTQTSSCSWHHRGGIYFGPAALGKRVWLGGKLLCENEPRSRLPENLVSGKQSNSTVQKTHKPFQHGPGVLGPMSQPVCKGRWIQLVVSGQGFRSGLAVHLFRGYSPSKGAGNRQRVERTSKKKVSDHPTTTHVGLR